MGLVVVSVILIGLIADGLLRNDLGNGARLLLIVTLVVIELFLMARIPRRRRLMKTSGWNLHDHQSACPRCGGAVEVTDDRCSTCGAEFADEDVSCSNCGTSIPLEAAACPDCGVRFGEEGLLGGETCDRCRSPITANSTRCPTCDLELA